MHVIKVCNGTGSHATSRNTTNILVFYEIILENIQFIYLIHFSFVSSLCIYKSTCSCSCVHVCACVVCAGVWRQEVNTSCVLCWLCSSLLSVALVKH